MKLSAIVAMTDERIIGKEGDLPWHLPEDLKFFKKTTLGHPILMGRTTFDSIGRPLPKRENIVLTRNPDWQATGVQVIHQKEDLYHLPHEQVFIIGGSDIYNLFLDQLDELFVTHVHHSYEGDTHFPEFQNLFPQSEVIQENTDFTIRRYFKA